jgi:DNA polymerase III subunit delta
MTARSGSRLAVVARFKPAYLIHGDDHGRIAERRARLRALAEGESGPGGVEVLEGEGSTPDAAAAALTAMTLAVGRRFVIVDGVERWKDSDLDALDAALADPPAETTVAFFAREEGRTKAPGRLRKAVERAGGDVAAEQVVRTWELPKWVAAQARELGLKLEAGAASALVAQVGERQQRLLRELEKLRLERGEGATIAVEDVEALAPSAERKTWSLADALLAGEGPAAARLYVELRDQGERLESLLFQMTRRLRDAAEVAARLDSGEPPAQVKRSLRMPAKAAERFLSDVRRSDAEVLRRGIEELADLEHDARMGPGALNDTRAVRTILRIAA